MRQFANVSYSPWANPYASSLKPGQTYSGQSYYQTPGTAQQPTYRRIVLPPAPVFYHPGIEQVIEPSDDEDNAGMYIFA